MFEPWAIEEDGQRKDTTANNIRPVIIERIKNFLESGIDLEHFMWASPHHI
jgi:hypothetical protein